MLLICSIMLGIYINVLIMYYYRYIGISIYYMYSIISILLIVLFSYSNTVMYISTLVIMCSKHYIINVDMFISGLTKIVVVLIGIISVIINWYTIYYLYKESNIICNYLNIFSIFMVLFCISKNIIFSLICYEMIGLISYLLINFYSSRVISNKCSLYCLLLGKLGDLTIILGIYIYFNISTSFIINYNIYNIYLILYILFGMISKSAQYVIHSWLILAMQAPTIVSSLLLSSTLVIAGLYWIIKLDITSYNKLNNLLLILSLITMLLMGISGYLAFDLKRIIAYSTSAQMSFIIIILSINYYLIGVLLIFNLGLNKSLLFLSVGIIILSYYNIQDIRLIRTYNSISYIFILLTTINLIGFNYSLIYISKEIILDHLLLLHLVYIKYILLLASIITISYSIKLLLIIH